MKKNNLSLWTFSYRKSYYFTHPWKWFEEIYWNIRNTIHRGRYGFAYADVWSWYSWWSRVGAEALRYLAEHHHGYPGYEPWDTPEKWDEYLVELADKLDWCADSCEMDCHEKTNEYWNAFLETSSFLKKRTPEENEIAKKYWERENELTEQDEQKRAEIFAEIGRLLPRFWD